MPTAQPTSATAPTRIAQIGIRVHDVARATAFYRDRIGLRFLFSAGPTLAFFDCGGVRLMLSTPEKAEFDHPSSIIYLAVSDIAASHAAARAAGVGFIDEPHVVARLPHAEIWMAFFRDSEGNTLAFTEERASKT